MVWMTTRAGSTRWEIYSTDERASVSGVLGLRTGFESVCGSDLSAGESLSLFYSINNKRARAASILNVVVAALLS